MNFANCQAEKSSTPPVLLGLLSLREHEMSARLKSKSGFDQICIFHISWNLKARCVDVSISVD